MKFVRSIAAIVVGWIASAVLITGVEIGNFVLFRPPSDKTMLEQMQEFEAHPKILKAFVESLPPSAMAAVLVGWVAGAFVGGSLAALIGGRWQRLHAGIIGALVLAGVVMNALTMKEKIDFTHPSWIMIAGLLLPLPMSILAGMLVTPRTPPPTPVTNP